jgi:Fur family ferric uptake transcriptional regulator
LQTLAAAALVDLVRTATGESVSRRCAAPHHHHHRVCRHCGSAVEVSGREVEAWAAEIAAAHGFVDVHHTIELFGTCGQCQQA